MLQTWDKQTPGRVESIFRAISHVAPSQLADINLFDFSNLSTSPSDEEISTTVNTPAASWLVADKPITELPSIPIKVSA